jgi:tetratricopeptide (TPR) repeat protein
MRSCPNCEREVAEGANFCANCGSSLRTPAMEAIVDDARRALKKNPGDADAHYNLALAYKMTGPEELALREFVAVTELQPDFADAHVEAAALYAKLGQTEQAVAAAQRALAAEPENRAARRLLDRLGTG